MPSTRLIASRTIHLSPGQIIGLDTDLTPPNNPMTMAATVAVLRGGPMYFDATEGGIPNTSMRPAELGDELDVLGAEDLRLVRLMVTATTRLHISYFGGGDQVT